MRSTRDGEQSRRIGVFCSAYGIAHGPAVIEAIRAAVVVNIERLRRERRLADVEWWQAQLAGSTPGLWRSV